MGADCDLGHHDGHRHAAYAQAAETGGRDAVPIPMCRSRNRKAIPVLFGTRVINQPNVVWYGDVKTTEIRQSSGSGGKK